MKVATLAPCLRLGKCLSDAPCGGLSELAQLLNPKKQLETVSKAVCCRAVRSPRKRGAELTFKASRQHDCTASPRHGA